MTYTSRRSERDVDVAAARYVLQEIESGDPERMAKLKKYLRESLEVSRKEAEEYHSASE